MSEFYSSGWANKVNLLDLGISRGANVSLVQALYFKIHDYLHFLQVFRQFFLIQSLLWHPFLINFLVSFRQTLLPLRSKQVGAGVGVGFGFGMQTQFITTPLPETVEKIFMNNGPTTIIVCLFWDKDFLATVLLGWRR